MQKPLQKKTLEFRELLRSDSATRMRAEWNELVSEFSAGTGVESGDLAVFFLELPLGSLSSEEQSEWVAQQAKSLSCEDQMKLQGLTSPRRRLEFCVGRSLKSLCWDRFPGAEISLSHSVRISEKDSLLGCVAVARRCGRAGETSLFRVGVDLEAAARPVSDGVFRKLVPEEAARYWEEQRGRLGRIRGWCEREALWKANPSSDRGILLDYQRGRGGRYEFRAQLSPQFWTRSVQVGDWVVAFALGSSEVAR